MNMTKKINVNFSSLVGLKAELLRKQAEVNEAKLKTEPVTALPLFGKTKKKSKKTVANGRAEEKAERPMDSEDRVAHKKSKLMLEAKARLYERLKKSKTNNDKFLVDFENNVDEPDQDVADETRNEEYPLEPEETWVEYQDCFGRTRKCLREDLPHMRKKDDSIKQEIMKKHLGEEEEEENKEQYSAREKEPEIEIMRRKWEEQTRKLVDKADIHYQDILFDEARAHGVGYYAFSQDEEERTKQQENLANLRKETERKQRETKEIKELKERMEQNRTKAARIRQRIRAGLPAEPTEQELAQEMSIQVKSTETADRVATSVVVAASIQEKETTDEDKIKAFGELLGKKNHWRVMSQEEWVDKRRAQRRNEFGPVYDNFTSGGFYNRSRNAEQSTRKENEKPDNADTRNSRNAIEESNTNLQNREDSNASVGTETVFIAKDRDSTSQTDKNNLPRYNAATTSSHDASESTRGPTTTPAVTFSQGQTTVSSPLSHLAGAYSRTVHGSSEIYTPEQQKQTDATTIPLPGETDVSSSASNSVGHANGQESVSRNINEANITAGLKYLREKFEASHGKRT
ncbi:uncharacterized protein LOC143906886 [Temnothorax americanus]|uniref:uncharacterized protein LOC143906886 n=1 Tax=Temnothorax americanus TaxID=1964332 RepID=UPI0040690083